ncbi:hypothetical protein Patl_3375 [Paraglaciecola sp. T6c]|uniref:VC2046/SO_2500 family protein n=1 Tax=Pseudoalteromonas atlantica (strain T6c / ATCC BAA-1087) TaxID=3042615 RepID=UPI00005C59C1|nr:VC2046/SO_2500 family protein [Paraglaciecola sp. T6c]ABG41881.1 hypothetical protein Patl_3375 [Paraglaciecola sp. T6c]
MQETQSAQHNQTVNKAAQDLEFGGSLNRASSQGAKFALLLSMLQQDVLARPRIGAPNEAVTQQAYGVQSDYPEAPLQAIAQDWPLADTTSQLLHSDGIRSAQLWLAMHPQPLSLHNDAFHIDEDIFENCDIHTQSRYAQHVAGSQDAMADNGSVNEIKVDETGIFDLLEEIGLQMQA